MMRRKAILLSVLSLICIFGLVGCTSSENMQMQPAGAGDSVYQNGSQTSGTVSGAANGTSTGSSDTTVTDIQLNDGSGISSDSTAGENAPGAVDQGSSLQNGSSGAGSVSDTQSQGTNTTDIGIDSGTDTTESTAADAAGGSDTGAAGGEIPGEFHGNKLDGTDQDGLNLNGDIWSGVYIDRDDAGEIREQITVTKIDAGTISFQFLNAGISGKAEIKEPQAIFKGDDYHVIVFDLHEGVIQVAVVSEEDFDSSDSPLIGTYVRE